MQLTETFIQNELYRIKRSASQIILGNYTPTGWYECDLYAVTKAGYWSEYEIKLSLSDFEADFRNKKPKHMMLASDPLKGPKQFWFVMPRELAEQVSVPSYAGLIAVTKRGRWMRTDTLKIAPTRPSRKASEKAILRAYRNGYYRYWSTRGQ